MTNREKIMQMSVKEFFEKFDSGKGTLGTMMCNGISCDCCPARENVCSFDDECELDKWLDMEVSE